MSCTNFKNKHQFFKLRQSVYSILECALTDMTHQTLLKKEKKMSLLLISFHGSPLFALSPADQWLGSGGPHPHLAWSPKTPSQETKNHFWIALRPNKNLKKNDPHSTDNDNSNSTFYQLQKCLNPWFQLVHCLRGDLGLMEGFSPPGSGQ